MGQIKNIKLHIVTDIKKKKTDKEGDERRRDSEVDWIMRLLEIIAATTLLLFSFVLAVGIHGATHEDGRHGGGGLYSQHFSDELDKFQTSLIPHETTRRLKQLPRPYWMKQNHD